jgi:proteic killer suppression protein
LIIVTSCVIILAVILSFADKGTGRLFYREPVRAWGADVLKAGLRKLRILDAATSIEDLKSPPGNRLEKLSGDRAGQWSIRVNDQWRICFTWSESGAANVELVDYH